VPAGAAPAAGAPLPFPASAGPGPRLLVRPVLPLTPSETTTWTAPPPIPPQLGVKALWLLGLERRAPELVSAASTAAPQLAGDFDSLAARVARALGGCNPQVRSDLMASSAYLSCVDLSAVSGRHHVSSPALDASPAPGDAFDEDLCPVPA
jgi:hypothetical protein